MQTPMSPALLQHIQDQIDKLGLGLILKTEPCSGGCIADTAIITTDKDNSLFVKTHSNPPENFFQSEALGLITLNDLLQACTLKVPQVLAATDNCLLLEFLPPASIEQENFWLQLAEGLATIHTQTLSCFGFEADNYCGTTRQPNPKVDNGYEFFGEHRLYFQAKLACNKQLLTTRDIADIEALITKLPQLIPKQAPSLLHGDLWSGNIHSCLDATHGANLPALIDPACYWGWREADIAMSRLFGGVPPMFYEHYQTLLPMETGWQQRMDIYNLYHLLNHLNLFGGSYRQQAMSIVQRFI